MTSAMLTDRFEFSISNICIPVFDCPAWLYGFQHAMFAPKSLTTDKRSADKCSADKRSDTLNDRYGSLIHNICIKVFDLPAWLYDLQPTMFAPTPLTHNICVTIFDLPDWQYIVSRWHRKVFSKHTDVLDQTQILDYFIGGTDTETSITKKHWFSDNANTQTISLFIY